MNFLYFVLGAGIGCLFGLFWFVKTNIKTRPKVTIITTMAILIFFVTSVTIVKTYRDYSSYLSQDTQSLIISNVTFALFLDFSVLIIGGLFLYLANQYYLADALEAKKIEEALKRAKEIEKEAEKEIERVRKGRAKKD